MSPRSQTIPSPNAERAVESLALSMYNEKSLHVDVRRQGVAYDKRRIRGL
jgi:hypothetical protein